MNKDVKYILKNPSNSTELCDLDNNIVIFDCMAEVQEALETFNDPKDEKPRYEVYFAPKEFQ